MKSWILRAGLLALLCSIAPSVHSPAWGAPESAATEEVAAGDDVATAIRLGEGLERSRRWLDAIEHYEAALKHFKDDAQLKYGLRRAKGHFGVERRYADVSFDQNLLRLPRHELMQIFDEVYEHVRAHYVEQVSPTSFVAHGTESLYLALGNDKFLTRNLPKVNRQRVVQLRTILRDRFWNYRISGLAAAHQTISEICEIARNETGLADSAVMLEYIFGGCNSLDDYSSFLTPDRLEDLYGNIEGEFVGLGIEMKSETGKGLLLVNVLAGSPAAEGGMRKGEYIVAIEGTDCVNMTTDEAAKMLRGPVGSRIHLTLNNAATGQSRKSQFVRRPVQVKSIPVAKIVDEQNGIAYIQMTGFQKTSPAELRAALTSLRKQGMRSLIWDLRGNPGGLLTAAVEVLEEFISGGVLVSTRGRTVDQDMTYTARRVGTDSMPLVLLVDGDSASASEIVAGAIHDHKRGTIIGRTTFGKWSVQSIYPIRGTTGLRLTTAKFYSPRGKTLGKIGVDPDIMVPLPSPKEHTVLKPPAGEHFEDVSSDDIGLDVLANDKEFAGDRDLARGIQHLRHIVSQR
ncbi:MAG: S41 family peptidase [Planctomycetaceae bacterium]